MPTTRPSYGGFRVLLEQADDLEVVGEAGDGEQAVGLAVSTRPDVVLMDVRMPVLDGVAATRRIVADDRLAATRVIMLTTYELDEYVFGALRAGASGFLVKDIEPADLRAAVRVVARGDALLSPGVTRRLVAAFVAQPAHHRADVARLAVLTARETEVVALVAEGLSDREIGGRLHLSPATAKTHVNRAMVKLHVRDRAQLVVLAYQTGLVSATEA